MAHSEIIRKVLRFPGAGNIAGNGFACAVPGPSNYGSSMSITAAAGIVDPDPLGSKFEDAAQKLVISKVGGVPIVGIGIAADSAIYQCDLWLVGKADESVHHRLSPGNPYLGCMDDIEFAYVTVPNSIPALGSDQSANQAAWDATPFNIPSLGINVWGFPLRLELYRGALLPIRANRRAPYFAHVDVTLPVATNTRDIFYCVDGRRKIDYSVFHLTSTTLTIQIFETFVPKTVGVPTIDGSPNFRAMALNDAGATSLLLPAGVSTISFDGNPMTMIRVRLTDSAGTATAYQTKLAAWDD